MLAHLQQQGRKMLEKAGVERADLECVLILGHILGLSRTEVYLRGDRILDEKSSTQFMECIQRRANREPLAYILGEQEFWSLPFLVNNDVLIPRPETEFLLEVVFAHIKRHNLVVEQCVDLCCGSGVIAVVLARQLGATVLAIDRSSKALAVAHDNCRRHHVEDAVMMLCSDLLAAVRADCGFPLIVCNPPYVSRGAIEGEVAPEVARYEPRLALDGGSDGLDVIRRIAGDTGRLLAPGGMFFMECGADQGEAVEAIFAEAEPRGGFFDNRLIVQDYSGRDRVFLARMNSSAYCNEYSHDR
ncbi:MAG: peptide chain release factor N(5)-glutamine methyltransferase [Desulfopila sp.]